ncbi:MAG: lipopolysaccharide biosynthesis protein RfbH [Simkaniaceae bacterium]|nr:lipopolysaccharide biosynthesis protein RfbH [Simkaniaceae bacterium]
MKREQILDGVRRYFHQTWPKKAFQPGDPIPVSGKVFDEEDLASLVDSSLDFWLTAGRFAREFESEFAKVTRRRFSLLVNSGSSANLLAISALKSPQLKGRALVEGDEVITVAAGFPTTLNPILQNGLVPVLVDAQMGTYNVDVSQLEAALSSRTRALIFAHTLGNPFDLTAVTAFAKKHNLWLIEDCCDALGSRYNNQLVGTFGDLATYSFYPAHHITMGEGGAVAMQSHRLKRIVESLRDWGRDCWCEPGCDNTCQKRFDWQFGSLPHGYDHKYVYSHIGYNLKATDMQAAVGLSQLKKLPEFIAARKRNFAMLYEGLSGLDILLPEWLDESDPSWFGFPITSKTPLPLERYNIATRKLFGGNLARQPAYQGAKMRLVGNLPVADEIMHNTIWVGVYPGLTEEMICYMIDTIHSGVHACIG